MSAHRDHFSMPTALAAGALLTGHDRAPFLAARPSRSQEAIRDWLASADRVGEQIDLDASAHLHGAMVRRRGVPSATNLLCLALLYGPGRMPLRLIAERSAALGIAQVSEPALLRRLLNAQPWLEHVAETLILDKLDHIAEFDDAPSCETSGIRLHAYATASTVELQARQVDAAKQFLIAFLPWPKDLYSDAQIHWLLGIRWLFVTSTIKGGPATRVAGDIRTGSVLDRTRLIAHLIGALVSPDQ